MFNYLIVFATVLAVVCCSYNSIGGDTLSGCPDFPNNTDSGPVWWQCMPGTTISTTNALPSFQNGTYEYPIHLSLPVLMTTDIVNNGPAYTSLRADISVWTWGGWLGCSWHTLPTFGLTDNIDACTQGTPCPIPSGTSKLRTLIDFTPFGHIISLLKNGAPYQIQYILKDHSDNDNVISCTMFQVEALVH